MGEKMSGGGDEPAPAALWARVRERYETGGEAVSAIAREAGITAQALTVRARREGWRLRGKARKKAPDTRETLSRFKALLQQRLSEFEAQIGTLSAEASAATSDHTLSATGLSTGTGPVRRMTSAGFDSTLAGAMIGVSINGGASAAWTVSLAQASLENFA